MMSSAHELNLPAVHDDADPPADRRIVNWMLAATVGSVPIVGLLFLIGAAGAWALARRWPRAGAAIGSVVLVGWLAVAAVLIAATRT
jgi:hypothetical protein